MGHIMSDTQKVLPAFVEEDDLNRRSEPRPVEAAVQTEAASLVVERREDVGVRPPALQFHEDYEEEGEFQQKASGPVLMVEAVDGTEIFGKKAVLLPKPVLSITTAKATVVHAQVARRRELAVTPPQSFSIPSRRKELGITPGPALAIVPEETGLLEPFFSLVSPIQLFEVLTRDRPSRPEKSLLLQQVRTERLPPACVFPI